MGEKLVIKNFAMFKEIVLEPRPITLLIGDNASGKSLLAKILYFCRKVPSFLASQFLLRKIWPHSSIS
jgi:predicted ATPase